MIDAALLDHVRAAAREAEEARHLPKDIVERLIDTGIFRASVPAALGGPEVDLTDQLHAFETLGTADASVAWCAMIAAQTSVLSAVLEPETAREIFDERTIMGGVIAPSGRAALDGDVVRLSGRWAFGSGVTHSDWFALGAFVMDGDDPRIKEDGTPDLRFVYLPTSQIQIEDTWHVSGLRGTGSNHVRAEDVVVPIERTSALIAPSSFHDRPLYRFPIFGLLALGVASVALGVARGALDAFDELASMKTPTGMARKLGHRSHVQLERATAEAELRAARALLYETVDEAWRDASTGTAPTLEQRAGLRLAATHAVRSAAEVVDRSYDAGGGSSIMADSPLQRAFRDVHAITQHMIVGVPTLELVGRILLGVEADVSQL